VTSPHYIAFEGAEACGKSTQAALLAARMDAVLTRETGGTAVGARLREILHDNSVTNLTPRAEALGPALDGGRNVVSDRSLYSTLAYQGYGRELDVEELTIINDWAINARWPETVIFLDTPDVLIAERLQERDLDRFEAAGAAFHQRVIEGFRTMASGNTDQWITVDGRGSIDDVEATIVAALTKRGVL